jgi:uncharacterized protein (TIGR03086 family)
VSSASDTSDGTRITVDMTDTDRGVAVALRAVGGDRACHHGVTGDRGTGSVANVQVRAFPGMQHGTRDRTTKRGEGMTDPHDQTEPVAERFRRLAAGFTRIVDAVPADRWDSPSPCADWTARDVLRHVITSQREFVGRAGLSIPEGPTVEDDAERAWAHVRDEIQRILDDPGLAGTEYQGVQGPSTLSDGLGSFFCVDLVVHGWDIANATGVDDRIPDEDIAFVRSFAERMGEMMRTSGAFGPERPVPEAAGEQERLLAFLGRAPA